jgi:Uma2 family endonuclease
MSTDTTDAYPELPDVDERLVAPDCGYEIIDGMVIPVPPALPPHATRQSKIASLLEAHTCSEYDVATDMLTRTSKIDDFAPDVSVFARAPDLKTGGRRLEELVVEIISKQTVANAARKAAKLSARGVRRVFGIDLKRGRVLEWSLALGTWSILDSNVDLVDPVLAVPLPLAAMLDAGRTDDAVARALVAKHNPVLETMLAASADLGLQQGREQGRADGMIAAILAVLAARGIPVTDAQRARCLAERDPDRLDRWLVVATTAEDVTSLFGD